MKRRFLLSALSILFSCTAFGQVWSPKAAGVLPANVNVFDVSVVSDQIIWAVCGDYESNGPFPADVPIVIRSLDGGETWTSHPVAGAKGRYSWDIHAFDANTACITSQDLNTGPGRGIFRTTDGGQNWTETLHHVAAGVWVHFFDDSEGVCINARNIGRTTDSGQTWTTGTIPGFQTGEGNILNNASTSLATLGDRLWFGTWKGRVFRSLNRGADWQPFDTGLGSLAIVISIDFVDEQNGLALCYFESAPTVYHMIRTTDGGEHWTALPNAPKDFKEIAAVPCSKTFVGTKFWESGPSTAISTDHGETWSVVDTTLEIWAPVFTSPEHGWVASATPTGANPALYKWSGTPLYGRIYVNPNATGANNGRGWADAYTDLPAALDAAQAGDEIWVAEGTYLPDATTGTFWMDQDLKLYGGFAGTECSLSERDVALHLTVLSGDFKGDDVPDDFTQNRLDNAQHVVRISAAVTEAATLDGFTVRGGHAAGLMTNRDGGGLYCNGKPNIRNCAFEQNFAYRTGGGAHFSNIQSPGILVENCRFENNRANLGGGLVVLTSAYSVSGCMFSGNRADFGTIQHRGGGAYLEDSRGRFSGCTFWQNTALSAGGGVMDWSATTFSGAAFSLENCFFGKNSAAEDGGAVVITSQGKNAQYKLSGCDFWVNKATETSGGAGIFVNPVADNAQIEVSGCNFRSNKCGTDGSGLALDCAAKNMAFNLRNCLFNLNTAGVGAAYILGKGGATGTVTLDSCTFTNNTSQTTGGVYLGNSQSGTNLLYSLSDCRFSNNHADAGGALTLWSTINAKANFALDRCQIDSNSATGNGGGIVFEPSSKDFHAELRRCRIVANTSKMAAAVYAHQYLPNVPLPTTASVLFENCLIASNISAGAGAVISADSLPNLHFLHCTIADNTGGGIALSDKSGLRLQNTILHNPDFLNYEALTADVSYTSGGGNLSGDLSLSVTSTDQMNLDPLLSADFRITAGSPCIDRGVDLGNLPALDLAGNSRVFGNGVDIGAYESGFVPVREMIAGKVSVSPNPAADFLKIELPENAITGPLVVQVFDAVGKLVLEKRLAAAGQTLDLQGLPPGVFVLKVMAGERAYAGRLVKQ